MISNYLKTLLLLSALWPSSSFAKDDWLADMHKWVVSSASNPDCKTRYTVGIYRPDMAEPAWGLMTEKMFRWFSKEGAKIAPGACPASRSDKPSYRILFSVSPMKTITRTTHGAETKTATEPFNATVNARVTDSHGDTSTVNAAVTGEQTATVVVPTETTFSQSTVAEYMYVYRAEGDNLTLISTGTAVFSRTSASGTGDDAAATELGAGIGSFIRASGDRHREEKLYQTALQAIAADTQ